MALSDPFNSILPLPLKVLKIDESIGMTSHTSNSIYNCKRHSDSYSCSCPAWRIQGGSTDARTCKHLRELLVDEYEESRLAIKGHPLPSLAEKALKKKTIESAAKADAPNAKIAKTIAATAAKIAARKGSLSQDTDTVSSTSGSTSISTATATAANPKKPATTPVKSKAKATPVKATSSEEKQIPALLLANRFELEGRKSPTGWWMSEKLDGIRAYWDGKGAIWSRLGNKFIGAPDWWLSKLPQGHTLDGELFHSRENFSTTASIVKSHSSDKWNEIRFKVFDIPSLGTNPFEARQEALLKMFPLTTATSTSAATTSSAQQQEGRIVDVVEQIQCRGLDHVLEALKEVEGKGGEGLMLREPKSLYVGKRSNTLLKVKSFFDADAKVIGYEPGKGKYVGMTGSLLCQMESGKTFNCGSGLDDSQRSNPPPIGAIISYRFQEITKDNVPRFPSFIGERIDLVEAKDADVSTKGGNKDNEGDE